jgi:hypothetical protein
MSRDAVVRLGVYAYAVTLVLSAALKALHPYQAMAMIPPWLSWDANRLLTVQVIALLESVVGGLLIASGGASWGAVAGIAWGLAVLPYALSIEPDAMCGCFGQLDVPRWVGIGSLIVGVLSCWSSYRRRAMVRQRMSWLALSVGLVMSMMLARGAREGSDPMRELSGHAASRSGNVLVIIGSWNCEKCHALLARHMSSQQASALPWAEAWFVVRESDHRPSGEALPPGVVEKSVTDATWWSLLDESPPTLLLLINDAGEGRRVDRIPLDSLVATQR